MPTAGRGRDTAYLCELVGPCGRVIAFDIQQEAVDSTNALLAARGLRAEVHLDSHSNMAIMPNRRRWTALFSTLAGCPARPQSFYPCGHELCRNFGGLELLKKGGLMCVTIYHGGATGFEERDTLLELLREIDSDRFQVISTFFHNWKKEPPIPIFIYKYTDSERD